MLQDIAPHTYDNAYQAHCQPEPGSPLLVCDRDGILLLPNGEGLRFPRLSETDIEPHRLTYAFALDGQAYFLHTCDVLPDIGQAHTAQDLRTIQPPEVAFAGVLGLELARWYVDRRYCGRCGERTRPAEKERAMVCPACHVTEYPKLSPAVIVAVTHGDSLLLTRYADRPFRRWALIAGFCEIGESVEQTVLREVKEEVGLDVTDLRYYKSQPWPFTDSLLLGFFCRAVGDLTPRPDQSELAEARWFQRQDIPDDNPSAISLTQEMIEVFRAGMEPGKKESE